MKREADGQRTGELPPPPPRRRDVDSLGLATLAGVVALLMISYANMRDIDRLDQVLGERLAKLEGQTGQAGGRPAPAGPAQQGADPSRVYQVQLADAPFRGQASAPVTIAEFSDFQCPFCARVGPTLKQIEEVYKDKVRIVWKHLPLAIHKNAMAAAMAAEAARSQDKFWEYHDKLFAHQNQLELNHLRQYAREIGLDMARFEKDLVDVAKKKRVDDDMAEARALGVTGTPGFFINGRFSSGAKPFEAFATMIDEELARLNLPVPPRTGAE